MGDSGIFGSRKTMDAIARNSRDKVAAWKKAGNTSKPSLKMAKPNLIDNDNWGNPQANALGGGAIQGSFKKGGKVKKTGIYKLHKGERVLNVKQVKTMSKKKRK